MQGTVGQDTVEVDIAGRGIAEVDILLVRTVAVALSRNLPYMSYTERDLVKIYVINHNIGIWETIAIN